MYVSWFSPSAPPGASVVAVRMVFVNRVPKSGIPSLNGYDMTTTLPSWISAAAALVTAEVTRLVAPVWSFGPHGEGGTTVLQSVWATSPGAKIAQDGRRAHPRGAGRPRSVRHEPHRAGVRAREPAGGREGRALRPLLALAQVASPALPRRVPGRRRPRGRAPRRSRRRRRGQACGAALRARLRRVRRRLRRPARRRAPGVRGLVEHPDEGARVGPSHGLSRAIDPLHSLRRPARRQVPLPRARRADRRA